jgi:hypothetical protein
MEATDLSHRIRVCPSTAKSARVWTVSSDGEERGVFRGIMGKQAAIDSALRIAEELRLHGTVLVTVEPGDVSENMMRLVCCRLAS